tara:strand:- start:350 stop:640 length:291 start_codon:yes stop_codon:yes gene_type:complete
MSRNLYYTTIPIANAELINFSEVMEDSWDTARWNNSATEVMVHWNGSTVPTSIAAILRITRGKERSQAVENIAVRSSRGQTDWGNQPPAPKPPRRK